MSRAMPLAAFSHNWIGGDFHGLQRIADTLYAYVSRVQDTTGRLSAVARDLTDGPGGWQGAAADAFTAHWQREVKTAAALEDFVTAVAVAVDTLAVELSQIESALEGQAEEASRHGVRIGADGTVTGYTGIRGLERATAYSAVRDQAMAEADQVRAVAARRLNDLVQQVLNPNPHPNRPDEVTMGGLLADLLAAPTASRREVNAKIRELTGKSLSLKEKLAEARHEDGSAREFEGESAKAIKALDKVQDELENAGRLENPLSRLLDTRVSDVRGFLAKASGPGRHVAGNTPRDLQAAAEHDPGAVEKILAIGDEIPVADVAATVAGTALGAYDDIRGGQPPGTAIGDESVANTAGTVAAAGTGYGIGTGLGEELGSAAGPVGMAAGAVAGYVIGDVTHNALAENWGRDVHDHGVIGGVADGAHHVLDQTADDARETAIGTGHDAEHYWDDIF